MDELTDPNEVRDAIEKGDLLIFSEVNAAPGSTVFGTIPHNTDQN